MTAWNPDSNLFYAIDAQFHQVSVPPQPEQPDIFDRLRIVSSPESEECRRIIYEQQLPRVQGKASGKHRDFPDPREASAHVKRFALQNGADRVAICRISHEWVYRGIDVPHRYGIILLKAMDYERIMQAPALVAGAETARIYMLLGETTIRLGEHIRELGHDAMIHHPRGDRDSRGELLFVPHAVSAGLGEHGRNGMLINPGFGPRVRLGMVSTDLELVVDRPLEKGIAKFCEYCLKCYRTCPAMALPREKEIIRGSEKFTIDPERCATYFEKTDGCSICIRDCVFNQPTEDKTMRMVNRVAAWHEIVKANPLWPEIV